MRYRNKIMILNGFPEESIYTDKEGKLQVKAFSTYGDETTVKDDRRGLFGVLGGVADTLTGNITDFGSKRWWNHGWLTHRCTNT